MKKFRIILLAIAAFTVFSCEDAIDIVQPGELSPEATFQTVDDLEAGLVGIYSGVPGSGEIGFVSVFTDEVRLGFANGGQGIIGGEYGFILDSNSGDASSLWYSYYSLINRANRVIAAAAKITPASPEEEITYRNVVAEARVWRAWGHFKLMCYFSTDLTDDNALGVMLVDFVPSRTDYLPRSTNGQVFGLIDSDLAFYEANIDADTFNVGNANRKYLSPDFVTAFKARMALYRGDYTTAGTLADQLIAAHPLTNKTNYPKIWTDAAFTAAQDEVIFRLDRVDGDGTIGSNWASVNSSLTGSPFYEMSTDLFTLLNRANDVRFASFIHPTFINSFAPDPIPSPAYPNALNTVVPPVIPIGKYSGSNNIVMLNDIKIFRTSEMVFIKAETQANAGDYAGVAATLQTINAARFGAGAPVIAVPANAQAAWAEILKQRRIELCYEGHRYLDLKRLGVKAGVDINRNPADCATNGACLLLSSDYRFTMPIPSGEINVNTSIRDQQNPGYGN